jgi:L-cysteine S-thiosulfotransferase
MMKKLAIGGVLVATLAGCASMMYSPPSEEETLAVIKASFKDRGIAKVDRLNQTELQKACTQYKNNLPIHCVPSWRKRRSLQ